MTALHLVVLPRDFEEEEVQTSLIRVSHYPFVLGRSPACDYRIDDPLISRHHCSFSLSDGQVWIADLCSRNGTRVNGLHLLEPQPITRGDVLEIGPFAFVVCLRQSPVELEATPWVAPVA